MTHPTFDQASLSSWFIFIGCNNLLFFIAERIDCKNYYEVRCLKITPDCSVYIAHAIFEPPKYRDKKKVGQVFLQGSSVSLQKNEQNC